MSAILPEIAALIVPLFRDLSILLDTLLGYFIYPFQKKVKRDIISATPKFYLFDVGIANYLARQTVTELKGVAAGKSFEHYILWN